MEEIINNNPNSEQVKQIFKYTYLIYVKFKDAKTDQDFKNLVNECHELERQYPFELCEKILLEICQVIDRDYKNREKVS